VRLRPEYRDHVWFYDFVHHRTDDGKVFRTLNTLDEYRRECLAIRVKRKLNSTDVVDVLTDLSIIAACPLSSDRTTDLSSSPRGFAHGSTQSDQRPPVSVPGPPWENGYCESFNARLRDESLIAKTFYTMKEAHIIIEEWREYSNTKRPHRALG